MLDAQPSGALQPASAFWDELLKAGYQDLQQAQMQALGKGKRERRQVTQPLPTHQSSFISFDPEQQNQLMGPAFSSAAIFMVFPLSSQAIFLSIAGFAAAPCGSTCKLASSTLDSGSSICYCWSIHLSPSSITRHCCSSLVFWLCMLCSKTPWTVLFACCC